MELFINITLIIFGLVGLYYGAEWLVDGSSKMAIKLGVSPMVVGLTVVAFGTSMPELLVCLKAGFDGSPDIALGNVVGSNICNIVLILGVGGLVRKITVESKLINFDLPILLGCSLVLVAMLWDKGISRLEGGILFVMLISYITLSIFRAKKDRALAKEIEAEFGLDDASPQKQSTGKSVFLIIVGILVLVFGAKFLVEGGVFIARLMGVSEAIIGLTLIAVGTSLPELATAVVAARKDEGDMVVGNAVGSSIFNILAILGIASLITPLMGKEIAWMDLGLMVGVVVIATPMVLIRRGVGRVEATIFLLIYGIYCFGLFLRAQA